jgi:hypothetical protein
LGTPLVILKKFEQVFLGKALQSQLAPLFIQKPLWSAVKTSVGSHKP